MKPDWKDAPEWANYLAMDGDGFWCFYQFAPEWDADENAWLIIEGPSDDECLYKYADGPDCDGIDWDNAFDTLEPRL